MIDVIILAAGDSTRMTSDIPKIFHKVGGCPIIEHVFKTATNAFIVHNFIVVVDENSHSRLLELAKKYHDQPLLVVQSEKLGTAHALKIALQNAKSIGEHIMVLYGDIPLFTAKALQKMARINQQQGITLATFITKDNQYGEVILDEKNEVISIIEAKERQNKKSEFLANAGIMALNRSATNLVDSIQNNNCTGEYYLTDIIRLAKQQKIKIGYVRVNEEEAIGVNDRADLAKVEFFFQELKRQQFLQSGVTLISPQDVFFSFDTKIAADVTIHPYVIFGPNVKIATKTEILSHCHIENCQISIGCVIGPFARIREDVTIATGTIIGNFVEIKSSQLENSVKVKHLSYIGNSNIGSETNIGAGSVICNYDGQKKSHTKIGHNCFIGANTTLISPITVGNKATIAAGSTVDEDVPNDALAIARQRQITIKKREGTLTD